MANLTREKMNMLSTALLSELAMLSPETMEFFDYFCSEPAARYGTKARTKVLLVAPEEVRDVFSLGYICGFIGRFIQLEEESAGVTPSESLPKALIAQVLEDIFGKMRGPGLARKVFELSNGHEPSFVNGYYQGGADLDAFIRFLTEPKPERYPRKWYEYLQEKIKKEDK